MFIFSLSFFLFCGLLTAGKTYANREVSKCGYEFLRIAIVLQHNAIMWLNVIEGKLRSPDAR